MYMNICMYAYVCVYVCVHEKITDKVQLMMDKKENFFSISDVKLTESQAGLD